MMADEPVYTDVRELGPYRYEWFQGTGAGTFKLLDGNGNAGIEKARSKPGEPLQVFCERTEQYFRGISGTFTVRVVDVNNPSQVLWAGSTTTGFGYLPQRQARRYRVCR